MRTDEKNNYIMIEWSDEQIVYGSESLRKSMWNNNHIRGKSNGGAVPHSFKPEDVYITSEGFDTARESGYAVFTKKLGDKDLVLVITHADTVFEEINLDGWEREE